MIKVGIVGGTGYTGVELLRLLAQHPQAEVAVITSRSEAGVAVADMYPNLRGHYDGLAFSVPDSKALAACDVVFFATPHGVAMKHAEELVAANTKVIDLAADFRLQNLVQFEKWYGMEHACPDVLENSVYGLAELNREKIKQAQVIGNPGCYPTTVQLGLAPLLKSAQALIETKNIIIDAKSGVSGAGRALKNSNSFCAVDEDFSAYGLLDHRHTPEIEQVTGAQILFTPHLAPMNRGILATCYARPIDAAKTSTASLLAVLSRAYAREPFVAVRPASPSTKATLGTNSVHLSARFDQRTGYVIVLCAIDNLTKGAAGGAVQAANVALNIDESFGLSKVGMYP